MGLYKAVAVGLGLYGSSVCDSLSCQVNTALNLAALHVKKYGRGRQGADLAHVFVEWPPCTRSEKSILGFLTKDASCQM